MSKITRFPTSAIDHNTKMYDEYIHDYHMLNGWDPGNQHYNFQALLRLTEMTGIKIANKSVLDVGCGTGDLVTFLEKEHLKKYVGIDVYASSIQLARKNHPNETFIEGDLLSEAFPEIFDYAFASGTFTVKQTFDNYDFLFAMLEKMWELTTIGIAFNVLTDSDREPDPDLFFYNPEKVLRLCHEIDAEAIIGAEETPNVDQIHVYMYRDLV